LKQRTREINNERIMQFQLQLANDRWKSVCIDNGNKNKFNSFLHTFINIFEWLDYTRNIYIYIYIYILWT
jgi:hypothetical protein